MTKTCRRWLNRPPAISQTTEASPVRPLNHLRLEHRYRSDRVHLWLDHQDPETPVDDILEDVH